MYKAQLVEEVEPQINELTNRAEKGIKQLERKEGVLRSKVSNCGHTCSTSIDSLLRWKLRKAVH